MARSDTDERFVTLILILFGSIGSSGSRAGISTARRGESTKGCKDCGGGGGPSCCSLREEEGNRTRFSFNLVFDYSLIDLFMLTDNARDGYALMFSDDDVDSLLCFPFLSIRFSSFPMVSRNLEAVSASYPHVQQGAVG